MTIPDVHLEWARDTVDEMISEIRAGIEAGGVPDADTIWQGVMLAVHDQSVDAERRTQAMALLLTTAVQRLALS